MDGMWVLEFIAFVALLIMVFNLRGRVRDLENKMGSRLIEAFPVPIPPRLQEAPQSLATTNNLVINAVPGPASEDRLLAWVKENWLLKLGVLLLLIGFGWLVSYAFLNNWIGPSGRITLGLVAGALILAFGFWRMRSYVTQGSVFVVLGATTILLTTYAARSIYDFFTPLSALGLMCMTSAFVASASVMFNRKQLAVASIILAGAAPLLSHSPTNDYVGLFIYLSVVIVGAVWIIILKDFREVIAAALLVVVFYSLPLFSGMTSADMNTLLLFAYGFAALFYLTNTIGLLRLSGGAAMTDLVTAAGNSILLLTWIYLAASKEWQSLIICAWAVVFLVGAFVIFRIRGRRDPLYLYAAIAVAYIAAATAIQLSGAALTIAFTIESALVVLVLYAVQRNVASAQRASLLLTIPTIMALPSMFASEWSVGVFNQHFFVLAILALAYFGIAGSLFQEVKMSGSPDVKKGNTILFIVGSVVAYVLVWLALHAGLPKYPDTAAMISLGIYTVIGIASYVQGFTRNSTTLRTYGGVLIALVVARLLIVDVWQMQLTGRIITFFLIGTLLMSTAFLGRKPRTVNSSKNTP